MLYLPICSEVTVEINLWYWPGILPQVPSEDSTEKVKVYLRVRPLLSSELERQEDQVSFWGGRIQGGMIQHSRGFQECFLLWQLCFPPSQGCVRIENIETLALQAPKDSFAQKSNERGIGQATHRFTFSQVWSYWHVNKGPIPRGNFIPSLEGKLFTWLWLLIYAGLQSGGPLLCASQCVEYCMCINSQQLYCYYYHHCP